MRLPRLTSKPSPVTLTRAALICLAGVVGGCVNGPPSFATQKELDPDASAPPGVAVDPELELPKPTTRAEGHEPLVVLETPPSTATARRVVEAFFRAVVNEDEDALFDVLGAQAVCINPENDRRLPARGYWLSRLSRLDYTAFAGRALFEARAVETFDQRSAEALKQARALPLDVASHQTLVRVALTPAALERPQRFGPTLTFLVGARGRDVAIEAIAEDFKVN